MQRALFILVLTTIALNAIACAPAQNPTPLAPTLAATVTAQATEILKPIETPKPTNNPTVSLPNLKGRALKVGSDTNYPPFESVNDQKQIVGFDVDLVNEICKKISCTPTFFTADFDRLMSAVNRKVYDFSISGWTITEERAQTIDFGSPYMPSTLVLLVRSDETRIKEPEDLKKPEAVVAVQTNTAGAVSARALVADPSKQVKEFPDFADAIQALLSKQASVVVSNTFDASDVLDQNNGKIKVTGKQFAGGYLGMVFRKGDTELKSAFDAGLIVVYQEGTWSKLCEKWWKDITPKPDCAGSALPFGKK